MWTAFRSQNDPETVLTLHDGQSFPYGATPPGATSAVLPDAGTVVAEPLAYGASGGAAARTGVSTATQGCSAACPTCARTACPTR